MPSKCGPIFQVTFSKYWTYMTDGLVWHFSSHELWLNSILELRHCNEIYRKIQDNDLGDKIHSNYKTHPSAQIAFHLFTISPLMGIFPPPKSNSPLDNSTISPLHHITISQFYHMCKKILIHHYTIWKTKTKSAPFHPETLFTHPHHPTLSPLHHIMISKFHSFIVVLKMWTHGV